MRARPGTRRPRRSTARDAPAAGSRSARWSPSFAHCVRASRVCGSPRRRNRAHTDLTDLIRFNEAIDQAIAESVSRFSQGGRANAGALPRDPQPRPAHAARRHHHLHALHARRGRARGAESHARDARVEQRTSHEPDGTGPRGVHAHATRRCHPRRACRRWTRGGSCTTSSWRSRPRTRTASCRWRRSAISRARGMRTDSRRR